MPLVSDWFASLETRELARARVLATLQRLDGNRTRAAAALGINRRTLIRYIAALKIECPGRPGCPVGTQRRNPKRANKTAPRAAV